MDFCAKFYPFSVIVCTRIKKNSDCFKIVHTGAVLLLAEYGIYGQIRAFKGKYNQIGAYKAKCGVNIGK